MDRLAAGLGDPRQGVGAISAVQEGLLDATLFIGPMKAEIRDIGICWPVMTLVTRSPVSGINHRVAGECGKYDSMLVLPSLDCR